VASTPLVTDLRNTPPRPIPAGNGSRPRAVAPPPPQPAANAPRRRLDRGTLGFWLGGVPLGIGGCVVGACTASGHVVDIVGSAIWWGLYFGCLGASIGALLGMWASRTPGVSAPGEAGAAAVTTRESPPPAVVSQGKFSTAIGQRK
jgi:hypothetical protein